MDSRGASIKRDCRSRNERSEQCAIIEGETTGGTNHFKLGRDKHDNSQAFLDIDGKSGNPSLTSRHFNLGVNTKRIGLIDEEAANVESLYDT